VERLQKDYPVTHPENHGANTFWSRL
jgi:hypothetical protein